MDYIFFPLGNVPKIVMTKAQYRVFEYTPQFLFLTHDLLLYFGLKINVEKTGSTSVGDNLCDQN